MAKDRADGDTSTSTSTAAAAAAAQSKRPTYNRLDSDDQVSDHASHQHQRSRSQKHLVGGGGRLHARNPSSKALHKPKPNRRLPSVSPERPERSPMSAHTHRRATSDLRLPRDTSTNLKKNLSHSSLSSRRNRSHVDITKRPKSSSSSLKRSSSHKDVDKLKGPKTQVHFDLGNDGQDDEWVDASASASPYMSRRGSVISSGQSSAAKGPSSDDNPPPPSPDNHPPPPSSPRPRSRSHPPADEQEPEPEPDRVTTQHNNYITSRLLQRTPSHGAPPQMSTDTACVLPHAGSPESQASHGPPSLYGTPKTATLVGSQGEELTSRFVNGSGGTAEAGSYFTPAQASGKGSESVRRPQSLGNLNQEHRDLVSDDEDDSALAPRTRRSGYKAAPAEKSRTQQKLNLQRASSSMEPTQAGGVGVVGASPLVGGNGYDGRDPRIGKLLERTGMEYLVVRRYQNPIARSIARLSHLPGANRNQPVPKQNGTNGTAHRKRPSDLGGAGRVGLSQSLVDMTKSRPATPRRSTSIRTNGANSSFEVEEDRLHDRMSGSSYADGDDDGVAALLRNLWDKSTDLSASQD